MDLDKIELPDNHPFAMKRAVTSGGWGGDGFAKTLDPFAVKKAVIQGWVGGWGVVWVVCGCAGLGTPPHTRTLWCTRPRCTPQHGMPFTRCLGQDQRTA